MTKKLFLMTLTLFVLIGCTTKREEEFAQGMGQQDLWTIKDFQGKFYDVKTLGTLIKKNASNGDELKLSQGEDSYAGINSFNLVNYTTDCNLLKDVPFRAKENSSYKVRYVINKDYLVVMKVAVKELLPTQEQVIAKLIPGTNLYEVPLLGYPISLINVEKIEDSNGDEMSKVSEYRAIDLGGASHFKIDLTDRKLFEHDEKNDVFPRSFFEGEWFYASTIVSATSDQSELIGRDLSEDSEQGYVSRIKFMNTVNSVIGANVNMDENIDDSDEINSNVAIEIPVEWVDYRIARVGKSSILREEVLGDEHPEKKIWQERQLMKIDFAQAKAGYSTNDDNEVVNPKFQNLELTANYFSFIIYYPNAGLRVKYAFKRAHVAKPGRVYFKEDITVFGFFRTNKKFIANHRYYYRDDFDKQVLLNRFYPDNNVIEYRFTHTTPQEFRGAAKTVVAEWNKIFQKADTGIQVVINDEPGADVDLGDLRYNIMNIVDTKDGASLLGYGPSIADTKSGELVSATTNVYVNPFRDGIVSNLRNYIRYRTGMFDADLVNSANISTNQPDIPTMLSFYESLDSSAGALSVESNDLLKVNRAFFLENNAAEIKSYRDHQEKVRKNLAKGHYNEQHYGQRCNYQAHSHDIIARIERDCTEKFLPYVEELVEMGVTHDERELDILTTCANKLISDELIATLVHEMGHNFGLRHNFSASNDPANFYDVSETDGNLVKTSSTMDYNNGQSFELHKPGLYDLAAIRFGYANTIETADGDFIKLDTNKTISKNIEEKRITARAFNYCSDEHVGDKDPLCLRHDDGQNPLDFVNSTISFYKSIYATYGHKHDKAYGPLQVNFDNYVIQRVIQPLKTIYEHWRFLLKERIGDAKMHLEMYSIEEYTQLLEEMKNDQGKDGHNYAMYYEASNKAYEFLKSLVKTTARYCVVKEKDNNVLSLRYADFEVIREEVYNKTRVTIFDCTEPAALSHFATTNEELVRTVGDYFNGVTQSLNPYNETETRYVNNQPHELLEIAGTSSIRVTAMVALTLRNPILRHGKKVGNTANFLDDPRYRSEMIETLAYQALYGTSTADLGTADLEEKRIPLFKLDQGVKIDSFIRLLNGMAVPGNQGETLNRWRVFKPLYGSVSNATNIPANAVKTEVSSTVYYATPDRGLAYAMINRINELLKMDATLAKIDAQEMSLPTVEQILPEMQKLSLIPLETLKVMTLGEFRDALRTISAEVDSIEDATKKATAKQLVTQELYILEILNSSEEEMNKMLDANAVDIIVNQIGIPSDQVLCYAEASELRVAQLVQAQIASLIEFSKSELEFRAQIDMLRAILDTMAKSK